MGRLCVGPDDRFPVCLCQGASAAVAAATPASHLLLKRHLGEAAQFAAVQFVNS